MEVTQHYNPVRLLMGANAVGLLGKEVRQYGSKCLLVIQNNNDAMLQLQRRITAILSKAEIEFEVFTDIRPNPLIQDIEKGMRMLQNGAFDVIVAVGGGSVIDTAKVLSISADESIDWKQCFQNPFLKPVKQKIPFIAVPTTAGTGSHCTQAAVVSDEKNIKHSIYSFDFFASEALVDYTLTMSLTVSLSASTGFDAFCHLSESYIMGHLSPIMVTINVEAMKKAITTLPKLVKENKPEKSKCQNEFIGNINNKVSLLKIIKKDGDIGKISVAIMSYDKEEIDKMYILSELRKLYNYCVQHNKNIQISNIRKAIAYVDRIFFE